MFVTTNKNQPECNQQRQQLSIATKKPVWFRKNTFLVASGKQTVFIELSKLVWILRMLA